MIYVALGANLPGPFGAPEEALEAAKDAMNAAGLAVIRASDIWLTAPVPVSDQPWYRNAVVEIGTSHSPFRVLDILQRIEQDFGRVRTVRNAPRVIDLDLIAYATQVISKPELILPHPRMHQRAFVLRPMRQLTQDWVHPLLELGIDELIASLPPEQTVIVPAGAGRE